MEMIIGGAYQGKENYARRNFPDITWKKGSELTEKLWDVFALHWQQGAAR